MTRRNKGPMTAQRVKEKLISERKEKPCAKCGGEDHGFISKSSGNSCPKEEKYLPPDQRETWANHELNPVNEAAAIEARLAIANADIEVAAPPQAQALPVRTVPGSQPVFKQGQSSTSVGPAHRGPGSSERRASKERPSHANVSSGGSGKAVTSSEPRQGKIFVPSDDQVLGKDERKEKAKERIRPKALLVPADYADRKPDGTVGSKIRTVVNFLKIDLLPETVFKYAVTLPTLNNREVTNRDTKRMLMEKLLLAAPEIQSNKAHVATDFNSLIFSTVDLLARNGNEGVVGCKVSATYQAPTGSTDPDLAFSVEYTGSIPCRDILQRYVANRARDFDYADIVTALNVFTCKYLSLPQSGVTVFGGNKFFINVPDSQQDDKDILLSPGLHIRRGFFASIRPGMGSTFLNVNVAASAFFNELPLAEWLAYHFGFTRDNDRLSETQTRMFGAAIRGLKVRFTYDPKTKQRLHDNSGRKKRVAGIGKTADQQTFFHDEMGEISVQEYFEKHLNLRVRYWMLPTVNVGSAKKDSPQFHVYVPPEYLHIEPNQLYCGKLEGAQTQNMIRFACQRPDHNRNVLQTEGIGRLGIDPARARLRDNFDLDIQKTLAQIKARILPIPNLMYKSSIKPNNGSWNLEHRQFNYPGTLRTLHVLVLERNSKEDAVELVRQASTSLAAALNHYGLETDLKPNIVSIAAAHAGPGPFAARFEAVLDAGLKKLNKQSGGPVELIVIVLDRRDVEKYSVIKRWADSKVGIPTVCSVREKFIKKSNDTFGYLALKINFKMGGVNHILDESAFGKLIKMKTMIMGADVTHPAQHSIQGCPSIPGVVATIDPYFATYPGSLRLQESRQEIIADLECMVKERLVTFHRTSDHLPESILFFRDGVSESQFVHVKQRELPAIKAGCVRAFRELGKTDARIGKLASYEPLVTVVVVGKRHQTRFFPLKGDRNHPPGLVVDTDVCHPSYFDFYLQAHASGQGTARSAHYFVVHDEMGFSADELQLLTMNLCHLYARATKSVSYVPAAYYADHLCERGRSYLRPMLANEYTGRIARGDPKVRVLAAARADRTVWPTEFASGDNPWHANLDDVMFYL